MNIGDYVRTKDGIIAKIKTEKIYTDDWHNSVKYRKTDKGFISINGFKKSSPNIIDLIEVGDFVNGYKVIDFENITDSSKLITTEEQINNYLCTFNGIYEIKEILTYEQYQNNIYKVERK